MNRENKEYGFMEVYDGSKFYLGCLDTNIYDIQTIAHALSNICRYGGHCKKFYSVAEHSVLMADYIYEKTDDYKLAFECLMHDASEAYVNDLPRPLKYILSDFLDISKSVEKSIAKRFHIPEIMSKKVKDIDSRICVDERNQIMNKTNNKWPTDKLEPLGVIVYCLKPSEAEDEFLEAFKFYSGLYYGKT